MQLNSESGATAGPATATRLMIEFTNTGTSSSNQVKK